ncbi:MAG: NADH:ubiquinone reductase (Na(+)-transporting) subunit D [Desulfobacteraceae bacterium]|nr:NADH:ubiquinone reductase (Na(+)-transporting) subunit D [Desulfobacteraceae bacterium]MBC2756889.1 NADH:ubiquinone reductase (Na(+)-transporting) subunit D [Desulfobacteraceae bacterium]
MKIKNNALKIFLQPIWSENPINVQMLGICSALAVTVQLKTAFVMALSMTFVVSCSSFMISLLRKQIPKNIRIIVELSVISTFVILTDEFLSAYFYDISKQLSVFVGLIITNCIVMGRAESFALSNPPHLAFIDGVGNGVGYGSVLLAVAFIRELLGAGKLFGVQVVPDYFYSIGYENAGLLLLAPAAFIIIGLMIWLQKVLTKDRELNR